MRKFMFVTMGAILALSLAAGCGPATKTTVRQETKSSYPSWFMNPPPLCAATSAKGATAHIGRTSATDKGRQELARQISTKVMGYLEQSLQNAVGTGMEEAVGHEYAEGATRSIHKMSLSGSRSVKYDFSTSSGEWLTLVCLDYEKLVEAAQKTAKDAAAKLVDKYKERHQELVNKMDENLKKEFPKPPDQTVK